jgi:hypothetical protein
MKKPSFDFVFTYTVFIVIIVLANLFITRLTLNGWGQIVAPFIVGFFGMLAAKSLNRWRVDRKIFSMLISKISEQYVAEGRFSTIKEARKWVKKNGEFKITRVYDE